MNNSFISTMYIGPYIRNKTPGKLILTSPISINIAIITRVEIAIHTIATNPANIRNKRFVLYIGWSCK